MKGTSVLDREASTEPEATSGPAEPRPARLAMSPSATRKLGTLLTIVGLASVAVVAIGLAIPRLTGGGSDGRAPASPGLAAVVGPATVHTRGPAALSLQTVTYGPGESSGWHTHPGLHMVLVLSGTLTVYGSDCQAQTFGPGQPYVGGDQLHVARNETDALVEMAVTYVTEPGQSMQHFRVNALPPVNCLIS